MPEGILIDYNDGRPVMAITAGLRAPSFCTSFSGWSSQFMQYPVNTPLVLVHRLSWCQPIPFTSIPLLNLMWP